MSLEPIDLCHQGNARTIAAYVVDTDDGPALFDCGPTTTVSALKDGLTQHGLELTDVRHLLLSHIHLDHAGAAGVLVRAPLGRRQTNPDHRGNRARDVLALDDEPGRD